MVNLYILCMVGAGAAVATQIAINAYLGAVTGSALDRSLAAQPGWAESARDEGRVVWHWAG